MKSITKSMQKRTARNLILGLVGFGLLSVFASCASDQKASGLSDLQTNYGKAVLAKVELLNKTLETVNNYLSLDSASRAVNGFNRDLTEINNLLPCDLSTVKRSVSGSSRSAQEVSLKDELESITDEYNGIILKNIPDITPVESLEDVKIVDDTIYLGGGLTVPLNSLEGIATVEYLNAYAETGDAKEVLKSIEKDIEIIAENFEEGEARGLYLTNPILWFGIKWNNGVVNYHWDSIEEAHKKALLTAMRTWEKSCDNLIKFNEIANTDWNNFLCNIGAIPVIRMRTGELEEGVAGLTSQIGQCNGGYLTISNKISSFQLPSTCLHELGHVLGLIHEHQRADRDNYLVVKNSVSYETFLSDMLSWWSNLKFPEYLGGLVWKVKPVKILWWTINLPYLEWSNTAFHITTLSGDFDFDSIMLYSGIELKDQVYASKNKFVFDPDLAKFVTRYNPKLSETDIKTVKQMYK